MQQQKNLDGDARRVVYLAVLDNQLPLLPLCHNLDPTCGWLQDDLTSKACSFTLSDGWPYQNVNIP